MRCFYHGLGFLAALLVFPSPFSYSQFFILEMSLEPGNFKNIHNKLDDFPFFASFLYLLPFLLDLSHIATVHLTSSMDTRPGVTD